MIASLRKLYRLLSRRDRRQAAVLFALMLVAALLEVIGVAAIPAFVAAVIEPQRLESVPIASALAAGFGGDRQELVLAGAGVLAAVFALKTAFLIVNHRLQMRFVVARRVELSRRLTGAYFTAPYAFHLNRNTAELLRNIDREATVVSQQVIGAILELATRLMILVAVVIFLFVIEPLITLFWLTIFGAFAAFVVLWLGARLRALGAKEQLERRRVVQGLYQGLGAIKEARILGREAFFAEQVNRSIRRVARASEVSRTVAKSIPPVTEFVGVSGLLALAVSLVLIERSPDSILVTLSLFAVGLVRLQQTVSAAMTQVSNLRYHAVSIDPVYEDLTTLEATPLAAAARSPRRRLERAIELRNVTFRYESAAEPALNDVSLKIPAGAAVGFVGATGAGKSTLIDVILGLLEPQEGAVLVDGHDIACADAAGWRRTIGYVPQSIYLLDDTIRRNVALGVEDREVDHAALARAIAAAQLEGLVARLPHGIDTLVGERGVRLSGGERQRIGIARALYADPDVLVLDEATSALDTATERAIVAAVDSLKGRRTILMIAHRLSTVRNCDTLFFLKNGRIVAAGDFEALAKECPDFAAMAQG